MNCLGVWDKDSCAAALENVRCSLEAGAIGMVDSGMKAEFCARSRDCEAAPVKADPRSAPRRRTPSGGQSRGADLEAWLV